MTVDWRDIVLRDMRLTSPKWPSPLEMAQRLDPRVRITPALHAVNQALVQAYNTPDSRLIISLPPQSGKSQTTSRWFPLWVLTQNPHTRITLASYETDVARRWGRAVRDDIRQHGTTVGLEIRDDISAQQEWQLDGYDGGMFTAGIGSALTGRPSQLMLIDDPVKNHEDAISRVKRETAWNWWTETAQSRLHPGTPVVLILTRWHADDLAGRMIASAGGEDWKVLNIPAQADHRPEKGEVDPLGREPGEYLETVHGMTRAQWERRKVATGPAAWASLYQGRPTPDEGGVFPREDDWPRYTQPMWVEHPDGTRTVPGVGRDDHELVQSWDLTFKDTKGSDFVVGQVWLRIGVHAYLLDQVRGRMNFNATVEAVKAMSARWPEAVAKFVEDKANGPAVINALGKQLPGLIPIEPEGSKYARASAVSPLVFANNVHLPDPALLPNVTDLLQEARDFPNSPSDDTIDAMSQALNRLLLWVLDDDGFVEPDEFAEGYSISPL